MDDLIKMERNFETASRTIKLPYRRVVFVCEQKWRPLRTLDDLDT